jgi:4-hydroxy-4-methyl-2-oxoglutarate aldolase
MNHEEIVSALGDISTPSLDEVMGKRNAMWPSIRPLWPSMRICGPALTVQARPGDNLAVHWALAVAPAGYVIVASFEGDTSCGPWGEVNSVAAQARGVQGYVTDGAVRDAEACRELAFPVFSQGISIKGTTKAHAGQLNVPVACGGVVVCPGDYVVGDYDGVAVVPADEAEEIISRAREREAIEAQIMSQLRDGALTIDLLGLRETLERKVGGPL